MARVRGRMQGTGIPALVGLLLVVFVIAGLLVYEALSNARSRREIAQRGLQDYAAYATWSTARAGDLAIGSSLSMLFRGLSSDRTGGEHRLPSLTVLETSARDIETCECNLAIPIEYFFRVDFRTGQVATMHHTVANVSQSASGWAAAKIGSFSPPPPAQSAPIDGEWLARVLTPARIHDIGFAVTFANDGSRAKTVGYVPQRDTNGSLSGALGFVASPQQYADRLFTYLWRSPRILPAAISRGIPNDSLLTATVSTPGGAEIYRSSGWERGLLSDTASLAPFGGGMKVRVALRRDAVARIGGNLVPPSRIPVWIGLLFLTGLLAIFIMRNLHREHELARLRADFTASVSHELRTPLAQILLFGETLTLGRTRSEHERIRAAEVIVREARRLMQMVENALQFSRAERPAIAVSPKRLRLAPEIREVIATFEPLGDTRGVRIVATLDERAEAAVDRAALRQMVINLLDNALKYGPPEQTISVGLANGGQKVVISVDDEGPGIPADIREKLWEPFVRGDNDGTTGSGLGLAVVRDLAKRHGGNAWVESAPFKNGSRFIIELLALPESAATDQHRGVA